MRKQARGVCAAPGPNPTHPFILALIAAAVGWLAAGCGSSRGTESIEQAVSEQAQSVGPPIDHWVDHVSTLAWNGGAHVQLFLRELDGTRGKRRPVVLMIQSRSFNSLPTYELAVEHYDFALWLAQAGGLDVFMLDFQGAGRSPCRTPAEGSGTCHEDEQPPGPTEDPCNATPTQQTTLLVPSPLDAAPCPATHPFQPYTVGSDRAEIDTAVEYIRGVRGVEKVHLVSYSQGSFRVGPYAVDHPEKVASVLFIAPIFNTRFAPTLPPKIIPVPVAPPLTAVNVRIRADFFGGTFGWETELKCVDQREPWIEDVAWAAVVGNDWLGRTWGLEGVLRAREVTLWGWNEVVAANLKVPTLIVQGQFDTALGAAQHLANLYDLVQNENKVRLRVQCAGHFIPWERQAKVLHHVAKSWLEHGEVGGFTKGEFFVDTEGELLPCQRPPPPPPPPPGGSAPLLDSRCVNEQ